MSFADMRASFYIHVPFCLKKCDYCDFYSERALPGDMERFVAAAQQEMMLYQDHPVFAAAEFETLYFGGGTPSLLSEQAIERLMDQAHQRFRWISDPEITLEANPETLSLERLRAFRSLGITRLSLGIQSFSDTELQRLGRIHRADQAERSIESALQAGFDNISLDLIFAIPYQTLKQWQANLRRALSFKPNHLSIYGLTIEPKTRLQQRISAGEFRKVSESVERAMYLWSMEALANENYRQYEISNFAIPGFECRHNMNYWNGRYYLGIGPSAHSYWENVRHWNVASIHDYFERLETGISPVAGDERLTPQQQMIEFIYLGLRTSAGIDLSEFETKFSVPFLPKFQSVLDQFEGHRDGQLFQLQPPHLKLTPAGRLLFDEICQRLANLC